MAYLVVHVEDPDSEPFWTLLDASTGTDLRDDHQYSSQHHAEEVADRLNGVPVEPEGCPPSIAR